MDALLKLKLGLEQNISDNIIKIFDEIINDNTRSLNMYGITVNAIAYREKVQQILIQHIQHTQSVFKARSGYDNLSREEKVAVDKILRGNALNSSNDLATLITGTTNRQLLSSITEATQILQNDYSHGGMLLLSGAILRKKFFGRQKIIALTTTQNAAEGTRHELNKVQDKKQKVWQSIIDKKTRTAHIIANTQRVEIYQPFFIDGELLMYPGDTSLGATLKNIAACRCSVRYE